uniref:Amidase n=1 Tax=Sym plasmid TaxID=28430 RepID=A0A515HJW4_9ZZZZ|nr:Amidase [Sym plasmid]QDL89738.1 Amidase [Sym plasmid]
MPISPPDLSVLTAISDYYGLGLTPSELELTYQAPVRGLLESWSVVEDLYSSEAPQTPKREWVRPTEQENPLNAWAVQSSIQTKLEGPLAGRTIAIKDNTAVAGIPMANGSDFLDGYIPARDATVVSRLLGAGATIAGKAVCEYLCFSGASITPISGPVKNPWNLAFSAGGSSSGSGALVAGGAVDIAMGGDQGGSVRIPASSCGIVGHKPTWGLVPYTGAFPIEQSLDHLGPMTRTVADAALVLSVIAGRDGLDPRQPNDLAVQDYLGALQLSAEGLRVGVVREGFGRADSEIVVDEIVHNAVATLRQLGMTVTEVSIPLHAKTLDLWNVIAVEGATSQMIDNFGYGLNWKGLYDPDVMRYYGERLKTLGSKFPPHIRNALLAGRFALQTSHGQHYAMARNLVPKFMAAYDAALAQCDVLIMPTLPMRPKRIADSVLNANSIISDTLQMLGNTAAFDITGHPACTVPAGLADGIPVGMMIVGRQFDDAMVLRVANAFERAVGGFPTPS